MLYSYSTPAPISQAPLSSAKNKQRTRSAIINVQTVNSVDPMRKGILMTNQLNLKKSEKRCTTIIVRAESDGSYSSGGGDACLWFVSSLEPLAVAAVSDIEEGSFGVNWREFSTFDCSSLFAFDCAELSLPVGG